MEENQKYFTQDEELREKTEKLASLRKDGVSLIAEIRQENNLLKRNKLISDDERKTRIAENRKKLCGAKKTAAQNKAEISHLVKEALARNRVLADDYRKRIQADQDELIAMLKKGCEKKIAKINEDSLAEKKEIVKRHEGQTDPKDVAACKEELRLADYTRKSLIFDAKNRCSATIEKAKAVKEQTFIDYVQKNREIRNGSTTMPKTCCCTSSILSTPSGCHDFFWATVCIYPYLYSLSSASSLLRLQETETCFRCRTSLRFWNCLPYACFTRWGLRD